MSLSLPISYNMSRESCSYVLMHSNDGPLNEQVLGFVKRVFIRQLKKELLLHEGEAAQNRTYLTCPNTLLSADCTKDSFNPLGG